jgi:hypothetical protein
MGKAADNERLKLKATFYNNLAVGSTVGGVLIPLFGLYQNKPLSVLFAPFFTFPPPEPSSADVQYGSDDCRLHHGMDISTGCGSPCGTNRRLAFFIAWIRRHRRQRRSYNG